MEILFIFGSNFAKITPHSVYNSIEQCFRLLFLREGKKFTGNPRKVYRIFSSMKPPSNCIWQTSRIIKFIIVILWLECCSLSVCFACYHRRSFQNKYRHKTGAKTRTQYNGIQMYGILFLQIGWLTLYRMLGHGNWLIVTIVLRNNWIKQTDGWWATLALMMLTLRKRWDGCPLKEDYFFML